MGLLLLGAYAAMFQNDLKGLLAYSTISHLGLITLLLGLGTPLAMVAAIFHTLNHATFKASLFMAAGAVDHEAGTRDLRELGGLRRFMPITATLAVIAGAAMAGVPLLNGFLSKELFFAETLAAEGGILADGMPALIAIAASAFGVTYSLRFVGGVFFGRVPARLPRVPREPPRWMRLPIGLLALACLLVGILPAQMIGPSLAAAAHSVLGTQTPDYSLALWHGWTVPLQMSIAAFVAGCLLYLALRRYLDRSERTPLIGRISGRRIFERALAIFAADLPAWLGRFFPARRLQPQLLLIVLSAVLAASLAATIASFDAPPPRLSGIDPAFALLWVLGAVCAVGAATQAKFHRLAALILTGGAGLVSCVSFVWLSAPDLAATQLLVEVVTTILILLGLRWLPKRIQGLSPDAPLTRLKRWRDALVALAAGAGVASLAYAAMMHPVSNSISRFFLERAYTEGGGHNVVNVILVDFRGFDTLGEISVLGIVALTVFVLLRRFRPAPESVHMLRQQRRDSVLDPAGSDRVVDQSTADYLMIPGLIVQLMFPVILLFGLHLFLRGHDLPGGGFAAGITVSVALILLYMARGARWVELHLRVRAVEPAECHGHDGRGEGGDGCYREASGEALADLLLFTEHRAVVAVDDQRGDAAGADVEPDPAAVEQDVVHHADDHGGEQTAERKQVTRGHGEQPGGALVRDQGLVVARVGSRVQRRHGRAREQRRAGATGPRTRQQRTDGSRHASSRSEPKAAPAILLVSMFMRWLSSPATGGSAR